MLRAGRVLLSSTTNRFSEALEAHQQPALRRRNPTTLQVNLGKLCNQACHHCHVDAGPRRSELMDLPTVERVLTLLGASPDVQLVDLTGGAPELNPNFRHLVQGVRALGRQVMVRCNLTVLYEPGQEDTAAFYAQHDVRLVASLPCYTEANVDKQRGGGTFDASIRALRQLNTHGYGRERSLDLVFNPGGPSLPPPQAALERDYRERLASDHGIVFNRLLAIANMPIHRFADDLERNGQLASYEQLLVDAFNPDATHDVMCRDLVSVDWDGRLAECDFHLMLELPLGGGFSTIHDIERLGLLADAPITTATHCLGCTAGQGSSCGGALTATD